MPPNFEQEVRARSLNHNRSPIRRKVKVAQRQVNATLKDFLHEDWVSVDPEETLNNPSTESIDRNPGARRRYSSCDTTIMMGTKSSKTKKKSSKGDNSRYQSLDELASKSKKTLLGKISKIRMVKPAVEPSTNPFDETVEINEQEEPPDPHQEAKDAILRRLEPYIHSPSTSAFFRAHQPVFSSESIHQNSILYRSHEILSARKRMVVHEHVRQEAIPVQVLNVRQRNREVDAGGASRYARHSEPPRTFGMYRRRLGGSFQTLMTYRRTKSQPAGFSASDSNLSGLHDGQTFKDYCPSGFYNRTSLLRRRETVTMVPDRPNATKRWSNFFRENFGRKRKVIDSSNL